MADYDGGGARAPVDYELLVGYELLVAKVVAMLVLGLGSFLLAAVPLRMADADARPAPPRAIVSLLRRFGGGVLLCTALLRLLPEARDGADALPPHVRRPADMLFCAGFFAAFLADQAAHAVLRRRAAGAGERALRRSLSLRRRAMGGPRPCRPTAAGDVEMPERRRGGAAAEPEADADDRALRGLFTVLALSSHEVFEGTAIGLQRTAEGAWHLFLAVAAHKLVMAFYVGLELAWSGTRRSVLVVYAATFAAVTPVGVAFGAVVVHYGGGGGSHGPPGPAAVVIQCLGALLYVVFFEVLARHEQSGGWSHLTSIVFGFAVMSALQSMTSHGYRDHSNDLDDSHHHLRHDHDHGNHRHQHDHEVLDYERDHGHDYIMNTAADATSATATGVTTGVFSDPVTDDNADVNAATTSNPNGTDTISDSTYDSNTTGAADVDTTSDSTFDSNATEVVNVDARMTAAVSAPGTVTDTTDTVGTMGVSAFTTPDATVDATRAMTLNANAAEIPETVEDANTVTISGEISVTAPDLGTDTTPSANADLVMDTTLKPDTDTTVEPDTHTTLDTNTDVVTDMKTVYGLNLTEGVTSDRNGHNHGHH